MSDRAAIVPAATRVLDPRHRVFLPQSLGERVAQAAWAVLRGVCFRWTPPFMNPLRAMMLRSFGAAIGRGVYIAPTVRIDFPWNLSLADRVFIAPRVIINCMGAVRIGERARVSQDSHLCAGTHAYQRVDMLIRRCPITIGCDVWIAADAFVGPGVTIGDGSLLAARSSAFHDLPSGMVCIGEPARPIKPWVRSAA